MGKKNKNKNVNVVVKEIPQVDIVIPVYSNYELLDKCLMAIPESFIDVKYKVWIVDDKSPDLEEKGKKFYKHVKENFPNLGGITYHGQNGGYPKSCNDGAAQGRAETIFILSTDVLLTQGSGKILTEHLIGSPEVGITFPKLLFFPNSTDPSRPAGKVQACGTVFNIELNPYHIYSGWDADHPFVNKVVDYNAMTGATFCIKRKVWFSLKGFDVNYGRGTYEDVDLSLRTRMLGFNIRYLPQAVAFHGVGLSAIKANVAFPMNQNSQYFKMKFGNKIPYDDWIYH